MQDLDRPGKNIVTMEQLITYLFITIDKLNANIRELEKEINDLKGDKK